MKKNERKYIFKKSGLIILVLVLMFSFASCTLLTNLAGLLIHSATNTLYNFIASYFDTTEPDNAVYGSANELAVGFKNGTMSAFWDDHGDYTYTLEVDKAGKVDTYPIQGDACSLNLVEKGYSYSDDLSLKLYGMDNLSQNNLLASYNYMSLNASEYNTYTSNLPGGWTDLDRYIASRYELFEMFNYIVLFQPDMVERVEEGKTYYFSEITLFFGYDYVAIYPEGTKVEDAYSTEIASAISAFDDSAGYNYSYALEENLVESTIYLRFSYQSFPIYTTDTNNIYTKNNFGIDAETPHYNMVSPRIRNFPIDSVQKGVTVSTSDQLYYVLKRGYRPLCVAGSNAEYIYNRMRLILSEIISDITPVQAQIHYIYDYIVDTVLYDYDFIENVIKDEEMPDGDFFLYKCLYMEGVFGFTNEKTFDENACVAICDGIAKAVLCMCTIEGIPVIKVSGNSDGVAHAWNKVKINGAWYLLDATWGNERNEAAKFETLSHDYFLVADDINHIEDKWFYYPPAPSDYE